MRGLLAAPDLGVRVTVCHILTDIGTTESIPDLEAARKDSNKDLARAATAALKAVKERGKS